MSNLNISAQCHIGSHSCCTCKVYYGDIVRKCDCSCHTQTIMMSSKFLVMLMAGCISAPSIKSQLDELDKYTDIAVIVRDSKQCMENSTSICGMSKLCLYRSMISGVSCKTANDSAANKEPADVQYQNDQSCKSDLAQAKASCSTMKELYNVRNMDLNQVSSSDGIPVSYRDAGHASDTAKAND